MKKQATIILRLEEELKLEFEELAKSKKMNVSEYIRQYIKEQVELNKVFII